MLPALGEYFLQILFFLLDLRRLELINFPELIHVYYSVIHESKAKEISPAA